MWGVPTDSHRGDAESLESQKSESADGAERAEKHIHHGGTETRRSASRWVSAWCRGQRLPMVTRARRLRRTQRGRFFTAEALRRREFRKSKSERAEKHIHHGGTETRRSASRWVSAWC